MSAKVGRNQPCPCGSGIEYKYCCISKEQKKRTVQIETKCESCGNPLEADVSDNFMNSLASFYLPLHYFCKDNDFYFFSLITGKKVIELSEKLKSKALVRGDFFNAYRESVKKDLVFRLVGDASNLHSAFASRKPIIVDACEAHFICKYTLSIPVLFAQIEGVLRDIGGLDSKDGFKPTIPRDIWNKRMLFSTADSVIYFNAFITKLYEGQKDKTSLNRNSILHGINESYSSEENSLILVLTLLEIISFLLLEKNTTEFAMWAKMGVESGSS